MPWVGTELFVASWNHDGTVEKPRLLAGREGHESIAQPRWGPDGTLYFFPDQSGYWHFGDGIQHMLILFLPLYS
ncbi:alpha/beta-hydrolase [Penicillium sp. IBT 35674x]|nr:alpha/beta-hydrolase [Penicillium sp. IBT 35674x]